MISHNFRVHSCTYSLSPADPNWHSRYPDCSEPDTVFKTHKICSVRDLNVLIKQPTFAHIKEHTMYHVSMQKYMMLQRLLYVDINKIIFHKLFFLEMKHFFSQRPEVVACNQQHKDLYGAMDFQMFEGVVKKFPYNWMFQ